MAKSRRSEKHETENRFCRSEGKLEMRGPLLTNRQNSLRPPHNNKLVTPMLVLLLRMVAAAVIISSHPTDGYHRNNAQATEHNTDDDPEIHMTPPEIAARWGYRCETHKAVTKDGYILTIHRIPTGKKDLSLAQQDDSARPALFLQHGLLSSSSNWVTNLPNESAAYIFADAGFDVWMGNFRGNTYSRRHKTLSPSSRKFWQFSWDEMARYDLPTMVAYVLNATQTEQLYYVGHSEGTLAAFAALSTNKKFERKIKKFFALGPVTTVAYVPKWLHVLAYLSSYIETVAEWTDLDEFLPHTKLQDLIAQYLCGFRYTNPLCDNFLFQLGGPNSHHMNESRVPVYVAHVPAGTSTLNIAHFGQMVLRGNFQMYDYGSEKENRLHYNQPIPPLYKLRNIRRVPIYLYSGLLDPLATPRDVHKLASTLNATGVLAKHVIFKDYNHIDFIWAVNAVDYVYKPIAREIQMDFSRH